MFCAHALRVLPPSIRVLPVSSRKMKDTTGEEVDEELTELFSLNMKVCSGTYLPFIVKYTHPSQLPLMGKGCMSLQPRITLYHLFTSRGFRVIEERSICTLMQRFSFIETSKALISNNCTLLDTSTNAL